MGKIISVIFKIISFPFRRNNINNIEVENFEDYSKKHRKDLNKNKLQPETNKFIRYIPKNSKIVLDCGGGDGHATALYARNNPDCKVYVIDLDKWSLQKVKKRKIRNLIPKSGNILKLPFKDASVDVLFCRFVVEHLYEYELSDFYFEAMRVLKIGGKIIIGSDSKFFDKFFHNTPYLYKYDAYKIGVHHHNLKTPVEQAKTMKKHGFFIQDIRLHLIGGRTKLFQRLYEHIIPYQIMQKYFSTMYYIIGKKRK